VNHFLTKWNFCNQSTTQFGSKPSKSLYDEDDFFGAPELAAQAWLHTTQQLQHNIGIIYGSTFHNKVQKKISITSDCGSYKVKNTNNPPMSK